MRYYSVKTAVAVVLGSASLVLSLVIAGCSRPRPPTPEIDKSRLKPLAAHYNSFTAQLEG